MVTEFSNQLADVVAGLAPSVVQVQGGRRPASGVVYGPDVVVTTTRALGREEGVRVRRSDGETLDAQLVGWDPATGLAVLRVENLDAPAVNRADQSPRVGNIVLALARSWSNAVTATTGVVAVIGGPLRTSRRRTIEEVIRITAPMHDGFAGGAVTDAGGRVVGVATATTIRGFGVVIPASIVWKTVAHVLEHGRAKRGYLGVAGQKVVLAEQQRSSADQDKGVLVMQVGSDSPAAGAGVLVGDIVLAFDGTRVESPDDLLDLLSGDRSGRNVTLRILRGSTSVDLSVTVGERQVS